MDILDALKQLDPKDDSQWTAEGAPKVAVVAQLIGDDTLKRKQIVEAAPDFTRESLLEASGDGDAEVEEETETEAEVQEVEEVDGLQGHYQQLLIDIAQLNDEIRKSEQELTKMRRLQSAMEERLNIQSGYSAKDDQKARMEYIASQAKMRAAKVEQQKKMAAALGLNVATGSPLDVALKNRKSAAVRAHQAKVAQQQSEN
jgi:hypothetical protein